MERDVNMATEEQYQEMQEIVRNNWCSECGGPLTIHQDAEKNELEVWCPKCKGMLGMVEKETYTQLHRRGVGLHPAIAENIDRKLARGRDDIGRSMQLLARRFPDVLKDAAGTALFLLDCSRLGLDPLIQPAEAIPVAFGRDKPVVNMIITSDGWLSMAARGCPDLYIGPPTLKRVDDKDLIESLCGHPDAWCYEAFGHTARNRDIAAADLPRIYGWFTKAELERAVDKKLPAAAGAGGPGNQAAWRATKKWVRTNVPECRQNMMDITAEWMERSTGVQEAEAYIDAEYRLLDLPVSADEGGAEDSKRGRGAGPQETTSEAEKGKEVKKNRRAPAARDPETITNFGELYPACKQDFNLQTRQDVWREYGVSSQEEITDLPKDVYRQIQAVFIEKE